MTGRERLEATFEALRGRREGALVAFVTAGDPALDRLPAVLGALAEGGADIVEIGVPFSDPIADGPVIQASSFRALERGTTPRAILECLSRVDCPVPLLLMGYWNTVLRFGPEEFATRAAEVGVCGTILCDAIPEEMDEWFAVSRRTGLANVLLAAPTSSPQRLDAIARLASGFVYAVSRTGVTGARDEVPAEARRLVSDLRARASTPVCVGFGVSKPEHVGDICRFADGAIVGSRLVAHLHETGDRPDWEASLRTLVAELKAATRA
ncbi:MAG: tryptophan synthase subunit alpha [Fimbriimonadales bacterium]|nr:tryptophan synthase subunit alpha [Fimbriimonadales bacterium]